MNVSKTFKIPYESGNIKNNTIPNSNLSSMHKTNSISLDNTDRNQLIQLLKLNKHFTSINSEDKIKNKEIYNLTLPSRLNTVLYNSEETPYLGIFEEKRKPDPDFVPYLSKNTPLKGYALPSNLNLKKLRIINARPRLMAHHENIEKSRQLIISAKQNILGKNKTFAQGKLNTLKTHVNNRKSQKFIILPTIVKHQTIKESYNFDSYVKPLEKNNEILKTISEELKTKESSNRNLSTVFKNTKSLPLKLINESTSIKNIFYPKPLSTSTSVSKELFLQEPLNSSKNLKQTHLNKKNILVIDAESNNGINFILKNQTNKFLEAEVENYLNKTLFKNIRRKEANKYSSKNKLVIDLITNKINEKVKKKFLNESLQKINFVFNATKYGLTKNTEKESIKSIQKNKTLKTKEKDILNNTSISTSAPQINIQIENTTIKAVSIKPNLKIQKRILITMSAPLSENSTFNTIESNIKNILLKAKSNKVLDVILARKQFKKIPKTRSKKRKTIEYRNKIIHIPKQLVPSTNYKNKQMITNNNNLVSTKKFFSKLVYII